MFACANESSQPNMDFYMRFKWRAHDAWLACDICADHLKKRVQSHSNGTYLKISSLRFNFRN